MIRLNIPNPSILNQYLSVVLGSATTTNQLNWVVTYEDSNSQGTNSGQTNDLAPVTLVSYPVTSTGTPANGVARKIIFITVTNADTVQNVVTLNINTLQGVNPQVVQTVEIFSVNLNPGYTLVYDDDGFQVFDPNGVFQSGNSEKLYYTQVDNDWTPLPQRNILNFFSGLLATDYPQYNATDISIAPTGVVPGTYGGSFSSVIITVNQQGQLTDIQQAPYPGISVGLSDTSTKPIYTITNSPVTSSGTIDITLNTQNSHTLLMGPTGDPTAQPTFRLMQMPDLPQIPASYIIANNNNFQAAPQATQSLPNGITAITQSAGDNSTKVATTSYVDLAVANATPMFTTFCSVIFISGN